MSTAYGFNTWPIVEVTGAHNIDDTERTIVCDSASDFTVTLPALDDVPPGWHTAIRNINTGVITIDGNGAEQIEGANDVTLHEQNCPHERYFEAYDSAGGLDVTSVATVQFATQIVAHPPFSYATGTGILTIQRTGLYKIIVDIGTDVTSGSGRSGCHAFIDLDTGGGYAEVAGTRTYTYSRSNLAGEDNASVTRIISLTDGDLLRIRAAREHGTDTTVMKVDASRFYAEFIGQAWDSVTLQADKTNSEWRIVEHP
jgi:hypothetical protein